MSQQDAGDDDKEPPLPAQCIPCESMDRSFLLSAVQLKEIVKETLPLWSLRVDDENVPSLVRSFVARNFRAALDSINAMGGIAEAMGHHPDFHITNYREVEVVVHTHKHKGVTDNDLALARSIDDRVKIDFGPKWLREHPEAEATALVTK